MGGAGRGVIGAMTTRVFIFECSTATYLDCVQKGLFGSNLPWPLQVKAGDYCCLYHYEVGVLFALWQATSDGGRNLVPRAWGGRFSFQARVAPVGSEITETAKAGMGGEFVDPDTGKPRHVLEGELAGRFLRSIGRDPAG